MDRVEFIFWFGDEETEIQQLRHSKGAMGCSGGFDGNIKKDMEK